MKIQLYVTPVKSGPKSIIRKKDGVYTLLDPIGPATNDYYYNDPGYPCDQGWAASVPKRGLLDPDAKAVGSLLYKIPEDAEVYDRLDAPETPAASNKSEVIRLRVTPEFKAQIQAAAEAENRTVSNYIERLVKEAFAKC